jgi:hypothetical protein
MAVLYSKFTASLIISTLSVIMYKRMDERSFVSIPLDQGRVEDTKYARVKRGA